MSDHSSAETQPRNCPRCGTEITAQQFKVSATTSGSDAAGSDASGSDASGSDASGSGASGSDNDHADNQADQAGVPQCPKCLLRPPWDQPQPIAITLGPGQSFVPPTVEELSSHIEGYDIQACIGQGGMGAVYRGRQQSLD